MAWADPAFDDSTWPLLQSNQPWSGQGYAEMSGFGWYRFTITIPQRKATSSQLAIQLGPILTTYQIYIDGKLAGGFGKMPPNLTPHAGWNHHGFPIPPAPLPINGPRIIHIAIRVWHSPIWASYIGGGPQVGGHLVGEASLIATETLHHDRSRRLLFVDLYSYTIAALIIGLTIFGLYLFRPSEREYLWFAILILAKAIDAALNITKEIYAFPSIPIFDLLDSAMIAIAQAALLLFLTRVLHMRRGLLWKIILGMALLSTIFNVFYWPGWLSVPVSALLSVFFVLPSSIWMLVTLVIGSIRRNSTARLLIVPVLLVQGFYIADNIIIAMAQFGLRIDPRLLENPVITVPFSMHPSVLAELIFLLAMLAFLIRRFTIARRREERWEGAIEAARQVQQLLLPEAIPQIEGFVIDCIYRPAEQVGGDFFQILPVTGPGDSEDLLLVVGDVAGKGLPAAMMVSMIVGAMRTEATHTSNPAQLLASLNDRMAGRSESGFTTCLCAYISANGHLTIANAGHLPPYRNGRELECAGALPLGILNGLGYECEGVQLQPGDRLTFVSDGVVEAQNRSGQLLGFDRTQELSTQSASEIAETASHFGQVDDITVVTIEFVGTRAANSVPLVVTA
jgi:hypothetical protein